MGIVSETHEIELERVKEEATLKERERLFYLARFDWHQFLAEHDAFWKAKGDEPL